MARLQNERSAVQQNESVFAGVQAQIRRFTPDYLATLGNVSRTTMFKYQRGDAVNRSAEKEILRVIKLAEDARQAEDNQLLEEAKGLVSAE